MSLLDDLLTSAVKNSFEKQRKKEPSSGSISATPRNSIGGLLADKLLSLNDYAQRPDPSMPMGKANPVLSLLADVVGLPGTANTVNELSYGNYGALGTGSGMTWKPKQDTVDAVTTLLPLGATAGKAAIDGGVKLAQKATPAIESAVNRTMANGGKPAQLLGDLAYGTQSNLFAGKGAKTADLGKLSQAEQMLSKGVDPAQVWKETGWGRGPDGKWRFEISDDAAKLANVPVNKSWEQFANAAETEKYGRRGANVSSMSAKEFKDFKNWRAGLEDEYNKTNATMRPLSEIFQHEQAASAYPDVYNPLSAHWDASIGKNGSFGNGKITFGDVSNQEGVKGLFGHELQHAIQQREGFARGGSPEQFQSVPYADLVKRSSTAQDALIRAREAGGIDPQTGLSAKTLNESIDGLSQQIASWKDPHQQYLSLGGEAEARLVQSRMNLTPEERAAQYPWNPDYFKQQTGVGLDDLIHRFDGGEALHIDKSTLENAIAESKKLGGYASNALETDVQGVIKGKPRMLDQYLSNGKVTEDEMRSAYAKTLEALRNENGDKVTLWRADAPESLHHPDTRTLLMANQDVAEKFAVNGRTAKPYTVNTDDVLGVFAKPSGYYEAIVKKPQAGLLGQ